MSSSHEHSHALVVMSTENISAVQAAYKELTGEKRWLEEFCAFDILSDEASYLEEISQNLDQNQLDIAIVPTQNRRKKFIISDMDSTLIGQECIDEIAAELDLRDKVSAITERAMRGEMDFDVALKERVGLLQGVSEAALELIWHHNIHLIDGGKQAVQTMMKHGAHSLIVSGGFTFFSQKVADALGFENHQANILDIQNGKLTGQVIEPILGQDAKLEALMAACQQYNFTPEDALAIGDGANDLKMITASGMGIAFRAKPKVQAASRYALNHTDLRGILYLQGYEKNGFAM